MGGNGCQPCSSRSGDVAEIASGGTCRPLCLDAGGRFNIGSGARSRRRSWCQTNGRHHCPVQFRQSARCRRKAVSWPVHRSSGVAVLLAISAVMISTARADDAILARGWTHENYGRLVLDTGSDELVDIKAAGDVIVMTFKRPVNVDMAAAINNLRPYLSAATPSVDNRQLTLRLKQAVNIRRFDDKGNLVIYLGAPNPAPAAAAVQTGAGSAATITLAKPIQPRVGEHDGFSRIAFDLPETAGIAVHQEGNRVVMQFANGGNLDIAKLQRDLLARLQMILAQTGPDGQRVTFSLKPGVVLRPVQQGRVVVLDLFDSDKAPAGDKATSLNIAP